MTSGVGPAAESAMDPGAEGTVSARWWRAYAVAVVDVEGAPDEDGETPGGVVYLAPLPDGPVVVLEGVSAVLYRALTAASGDVVQEVARRVGVPADVRVTVSRKPFWSEQVSVRGVEPSGAVRVAASRHVADPG